MKAERPSLHRSSLTSLTGYVRIRGSEDFAYIKLVFLKRVLFQERLIFFAHDRELCNVQECSQLYPVAVN